MGRKRADLAASAAEKKLRQKQGIARARELRAAARARIAKDSAAASVAKAQAASIEMREKERADARAREQRATREQRKRLRQMLPAMKSTTDPLAMFTELGKMIMSTAESAIEDETLSGKELRHELRLIMRSATGAVPAERIQLAEEALQRANDKMNVTQREVAQVPLRPGDEIEPLQGRPRDAP
jgi:hypothetical protein